MGLNLNTLITTKAPHIRASLHLAAIVAKPPSQAQLLLADHHDSFTILATSRSTRPQENGPLVQASLRNVHLWMRLFVLTTLASTIVDTMSTTQNFSFHFLHHYVPTSVGLPFHTRITFKGVPLLLVHETFHFIP